VAGGSFFSAHIALKTLYMSFGHKVSESHAAAMVYDEVPDALRENESLETLHISSEDGFGDYLVFLALAQIQH
jgi:hypothetical protein